jgi:integration host factor subunit alpha
MGTMTKADIVNSLYEKLGLSKKETANIVEVVLETVKDNLEKGNKIEITRRKVVTFKPSQLLRKSVNG